MRTKLWVALIAVLMTWACGEAGVDEQQGASFMPGQGPTGGKILIRPPSPPPPPPPPPPRCYEDLGRVVVATNVCTADGSPPLNQFNDPVPGARVLCFDSWAAIGANAYAPNITGCTFDRYNNALSFAFGYPFYVPTFCSRSCYFD